jgi:1-phosphatidylinositol phosphodiesterase
LTWQLTHGIRFIDIRFALIKGQLQAYHGPINQRRTAAELFEEVYAFLDAHPSETLLCSIKQVRASWLIEFVWLQRKENAAVPLFEELMIHLILLEPKRWFLEDRFPTLGEARGKIILFSRYGRGANLGIHPSSWPDNVKRVFSSSAGGIQLYTQDWFVSRSGICTKSSSMLLARYFPPELLAIPEKFALITQLHLLRPPAPAFRLNFCNAASFLSGFPSTVALGIGFSFFGIEGINSRLFHFLQRAQEERESDEAGQAFMLDFCDQPAGLIDLIVSFNFRPREDQSMGRSAEKKGSLV